MAIGAVCAAIYWSDLFTGLLHIYFDHRRCDIGDGMDMIAYSFRYDHHAAPGNFNQYSAFFKSISNFFSYIYVPYNE